MIQTDKTLILYGICKKFQEFSLEDVSFEVRKNDYFILLGESGAGKSMILEMIAGLIKPDQGEIIMNGRNITREKIQKRKAGLVFQDYAIFPHLSAGANIAYSLHGSDLTHEEKRKKIQSVAEDLGIADLLHRKPSTLSGGELQRVGLARTLVQEPDILLLDEPLSSLDTRIKSDLRNVLHKLHAGGQTILHVTHDYEEALALGTRIAVIHNGRIIQKGEPEAVFSNPGSEFVAHFTGARNFFKARSVPEEGQFVIADEILKIQTGEDLPPVSGYVMIREEDIFLSNNEIDSSATNNFEGKIERLTKTSRGIDVTISMGLTLHARVTRTSVEKMGLAEGKTVWVHFKATAVRFTY